MNKVLLPERNTSERLVSRISSRVGSRIESTEKPTPYKFTGGANELLQENYIASMLYNAAKYYLEMAFPHRGGSTEEKIDFYFWEHNSWVVQGVPATAAALDGHISVAIVRESYTYAKATLDVWAIYWVCVFGMRALPLLILSLRVLKYSPYGTRFLRLGTTNFYGLHIAGSCAATFFSEFVTQLIIGEDRELVNRPMLSDSVHIHFLSDFYRLRVYTTLLSLWIMMVAVFFINIAINSYRIRTSAYDRHIVFRSGLIYGRTGLEQVKICGQRYIKTDINTALTLHWMAGVDHLAFPDAGLRKGIYRVEAAISEANKQDKMPSDDEMEKLKLDYEDRAFILSCGGKDVLHHLRLVRRIGASDHHPVLLE